MPKTAILDIDGTLIDSNYHHVIAWARAFRKHGLTIPIWRIHRHVGMGGDQLIAALAGDEVEDELGDAIRDAEKDLYMELIDEVQPIANATKFVQQLVDAGHDVVLASSAKEDEVDRYLDLLKVRQVVNAWTTSADVEATKPDPDLIKAARAKARYHEAVMVGDSVWDCVAAKRAGIPTIGVLTGGFSEQELLQAGALRVFESVVDLGTNLAETPLNAG